MIVIYCVDWVYSVEGIRSMYRKEFYDYLDIDHLGNIDGLLQ